MEAFLVIVLLLVVFALWGIKSGITEIGNSLFSIDNNLSDLNNKFSPPNTNYDEYES